MRITTLTIEHEIDDITRTIECSIDEPIRKSWSRPKEEMQCYPDVITPPLDRPLTKREHEEIYDKCKCELIRRLTR